jgi:hypothetical protein
MNGDFPRRKDINNGCLPIEGSGFEKIVEQNEESVSKWPKWLKESYGIEDDMNNDEKSDDIVFHKTECHHLKPTDGCESGICDCGAVAPWIEFYPLDRDEDTHPFHVEFTYGKNWTLFKSNPICSKEEWNKQLKGVDRKIIVFMSRFGHPWNLGSGKLHREDGVGMNKKFLMYMVDALNEKYQREQIV